MLTLAVDKNSTFSTERPCFTRFPQVTFGVVIDLTVGNKHVTHDVVLLVALVHVTEPRDTTLKSFRLNSSDLKG